MILDIPELLLKVAHFSDWRTVHALQRLNRGAYRAGRVFARVVRAAATNIGWAPRGGLTDLVSTL